ncbi:MAG: hypothetical protein QM718_09980 [Steroidobacteraceae bacterium]
MNVAMSIGLTVLAAGLISSIVSLALLLSSPGKQRALSWLIIALALAFLAFLIGAWLGAQYFCSPADAGDLCGLGGVFGTGPLTAGLGLIAGSWLMLKARRSAP